MNTRQYPGIVDLLNRFRFLYGRWIRPLLSDGALRSPVQIPLWSMNTQIGPYRPILWPGSDSSMVDEYAIKLFHFTDFGRFRFLYGRWIQWAPPDPVVAQVGSDSSMVDEYPRGHDPTSRRAAVQIPLWSMNTGGIHAYAEQDIVQIPLWSMNTMTSSEKH